MDYAQMALQYIRPELLILLPILWWLGTILKKSKQVEDWAIPFILLVLALFFTLSYMLSKYGFAPMIVWTGIVQGALLAVVEGQGYQYYKQVKEKRLDSQ